MPSQNSFQVAEVVPTNLVWVAPEMVSQLGTWCVVPYGPSCYETRENALSHCLLHFHLSHFHLCFISLGLGGPDEIY